MISTGGYSAATGAGGTKSSSLVMIIEWLQYTVLVCTFVAQKMSFYRIGLPLPSKVFDTMIAIHFGKPAPTGLGVMYPWPLPQSKAVQYV